MTEIIIIITAATSDTISLEQALEKAKSETTIRGYITKLRLLLNYMILFNRIDRLKFIDDFLRWLLINK